MLDIAYVLVLEVYREMGLKFEEAFSDLEGVLNDTSNQQRAPKKPSPQDEASSMAMLQAVMGATDFKGAR